MFRRLAPFVMALTLGVPASSQAVFYGPSIAPYKPTRIVLQAVTVEVQPGHEGAFASQYDFRDGLQAGTKNGWVEELDSFHGRIKFFEKKRLALPEGGSVEIRLRDRDLPGRLRLVVAERFGDRTEAEVVTIRLDRRVGFEEGYGVVPLEGERRFLALAVELRR